VGPPAPRPRAVFGQIHMTQELNSALRPLTERAEQLPQSFRLDWGPQRSGSALRISATAGFATLTGSAAGTETGLSISATGGTAFVTICGATAATGLLTAVSVGAAGGSFASSFGAATGSTALGATAGDRFRLTYNRYFGCRDLRRLRFHLWRGRWFDLAQSSGGDRFGAC